LAACGGFSYGDVLGAGEGWAKGVLFDSAMSDQFQAFFERSDSFALGVCNGCQMLSALAPLIPGTDHWPRFARNLSEQYEARLVRVRVEKSASVLFSDMAGSELPIVVAHGEGRAQFAADDSVSILRSRIASPYGTSTIMERRLLFSRQTRMGHLMALQVSVTPMDASTS